MSAISRVPLSAGQRGLWLAQKLSPDVPISEAQYIDLRGDLDVELLREASIRAGRELQSGYLRLVEIDGEPYQVFDPSLESSSPVIDVRGEPDPLAAGLEWMRRDYTRPLDMTRDRLFGSAVVQVGDQHYLLYSRIHHVAMDGYGGMMTMNRIAALYTAAVQGRTAEPYRAADVRALYDADRNYRESKRFTDDQEYWLQKLADAGDESSLVDGHAPARADSRNATAELSPTMVRRIEHAAEALNASPAAVVIAAFGCYLARMTGRDDVMVNIPVSGRTNAVLRRSGGVFVNVAPLALTLDSGDTVAALTRRVQSDLVGALRHQRYGLTDIRTAAGYNGGQRRFAGPVVNVMFFHQEFRLGSVAGEFHILSSGPVDDLLIDLYQTGEPPRTILHFLANPNLYTDSELSAHCTRFMEFLDAFAAAPDTALEQVHPASARDGARIKRRRANLAFWRATLANLPEELRLPFDRPRSAVPSNGGATASYALRADLVAALERFAQQHNSSLFTAIHGALAVLLARLSGTTDIPIGTPTTGRAVAAIDGVADEFADTVVLRTEIDLDESLTDLLHRVEQADLDAFQHADIPFEQMLDELVAKRRQSRYPLFQVMLALPNPSDLESSVVDLSEAASRFDLRFLVSADHDSGDMTVAVTYATDLFDAATIDSLAHRWIRILESITTDPTTAVAAIDILEPAERTDLLTRTGAPSTPPTTLPQLLTAAATYDPDATAIVCNGQQLSYQQLDKRSNQLARQLIQHGIGPEDIVAISIPRSADSVLALWAVAKSGAAFLPIDPTYPTERITHMMTDSEAAIGLTVTTVRPQLPDNMDWLIPDGLDTSGDQPNTDDSRPITDSDRVRPLRIDDIAYVIYTSGSTGLPKGVAVTHRGLGNCAAEHRVAMGVEPSSRALHLASPSFDVSVLELLIPLAAGATMVIAPNDIYGGDELAELLDREHISHLLISPSVLSTIDHTRWPLPDLKYLMVGGEDYGSELVERWGGDRVVLNEYGPTETTISATLNASLAVGELVTIGRPMPGASTWVLDQRLQPVPVGVAGELYIAGDLLARGYHHRTATTAERFIACPWLPGQRMYRTGDIVRWTNNTTIQHLGRSDFQVKIRGLRIELGEIDTTLTNHETVAYATTIGHHNDTGTQTLISYVVPTPNHTINTTTLTEYLTDHLPSYMIPASITALDHIPLTPVGKLDRKALPKPVFTDTKPFRAPHTPTEHTIARAFIDVLGIDTIGLDDSFFALGGDSLVATRVAARLGAAFDAEIPVRLLFEASTVAELATRIDRHAGTGRRRPPLVAGPRPDLVPLAPAQQRMWFFNQYDTASGAYNMPIAIRLRGALNVDALHAAVLDVLGRHESLRTRYPDHDGMLIQLIEPVENVDRELIVAPVAPSQLVSTVTEFVAEGFDVTTQPPARAQLFRIVGGEQPEYVLAVVVHHIAADGFSLTPLARDVATAYAARIHGAPPAWTPLPVQYADYALWQQATLGAPDDPESLSAQQIRYWTEALDGVAEELRLPFDRPRPVVMSNRGATVNYSVPAELVRALEQFARQHNSSLFMAIHGALAVLLARLSGTTDIPIGTPIAGRGVAALDDMIGMFVNTLVLRTEIDPAESFTDLLGRIKQADLDAFEHADVPFEQVVDKLVVQRSQARHPLFQVMLAFQNLEPVTLRLPDLELSVVDLPNEVSRFDLQFILSENHDSGDMTVAVTYATDLFDAATIDSLAHRWIRILESITTDPTTAVAAIDILEPAERTDLLTRTGAPSTPPTTLPQLLTAAATYDPDATAIVCNGQQLSYQQLDKRSNQLARQLIQHGIGPEDIVAISIPRSADSVLALWAVAKSGAAFLPIDPTYPTERITHMMTDSEAAIGITTASVHERLPDDTDWLTFDDLDEADSSPITDCDRVRPLRIDDIAYVIYTSGSTGLPKGVAVTHRGLGNCATANQDVIGVEPNSRTLHLASPSFDVSVLEMLLPLPAGATMVIAPNDIYGGDELAELLDREHISHLLITPSALSTIDDTRWPLPDLDNLVVGGENYGSDLVERWGSERKLLNDYGPTETTVTATRTLLTAGDLVTIGRPIRGVSAWILDQRLQPVPDGVAGELYIAGDLLARGYHHRTATTAERFIACPWLPGQRMYRTGDIVRWTNNTTIQHLGRSDFQVKIRGLRIELGEIDTTLTNHETVAYATTIGHHNDTGTQTLISYVVPTPNHTINTTTLTEYLTDHLPSYMIPASITALDHIPLTPVGKLDRKALPKPVFTDTKPFRAPQTPIEHIIAGVFADVLGADTVGLDDSFFALGGDSIMSIQLVTRARAAGVAFSARDVFERKTVAGLAEVAVDGSAGSVLSELPGAGVGPVPLTPIMRRLLARSESEIGRFSQAMMLNLPMGIDRQRLADTVQAVLDRHDMLRARLCPDDDGRWMWDVLPVGTVRADEVIHRVPMQAMPADTEFRTLAAEELTSAADRLDPNAGIVLQVVWFDPVHTAEPGKVLVLVHHSAIDRDSWRVLVPDLAVAWARIESGAPPDLGSVGTSMRRWAHGLVEAAQHPERVAELGLWRAMADGPDPMIGSRPLDSAIDVAATARTVEIELSPEVTDAVLTKVPATFHGGVSDGLLAALAVAVTKWRRDRQPETAELTDVLIDLEGHGREEGVVPGADLTRTVGWFATSFPVRLDLSGIDLDDAYAGGPAMGAAVKSVKEQLLAVPDHGIGYGLLRYLNEDTGPTLGALPTPQIAFNYIGRVSTRIPEGISAVGWLPVDGGDLVGAQNSDKPVAAVLDINAYTRDDGEGPQLRAVWSYPDGVLTADEVSAVAQSWCGVLTALAAHARRGGSGGRTPSDLDLVRLGQAEIERLEDRYPTLSDVWPLTPLQEGLLFHALLSEESVDAYLTQLVLELRGQVDAERLRRAAQVVLDRHPNLRTAFDATGAGPVQVVQGQVEACWSQVDLSGLDEDAREREWEALLAADRVTRFDPARAPLLRWMLVSTGPQQFRLVLTNHHLLLDGWSTPLLLKELLVLYATDGDATILPEVRPYRDFLAWIAGQDLPAALDAWAAAFDGAAEPTLVAQADPGRRYTESRDVVADLTEEQTAALTSFARARGVTLNTVIQLAWAIVLGSLTSQDDVSFGAAVSGRSPQLAGIESMIGLFINTLPVRVRLDAAESLGQLLDRIQAEQTALLDHQFVGLTEIERVAGPAAVFDTMTVFESFPIDRFGLTADTDIAGMRVVDVTGVDGAHYPLGVVARVDTRLHLTIKYLPELFDHDTVTATLQRVLRVLGIIAADPDRPLARLNLLSPAEYRELTPVSGSPEVPGRLLPELLAATVERDPGAVAVVYEDRQWSYGELDAESNRLARLLIDQGVGPEASVAVGLARSVESVLAVWAVAKSGAAFVPVDPQYPTGRIEHMLTDSGVRVGITLSQWRDRFPGFVRWLVLDEATAQAEVAQASAAPVTDAERTRPVRLDQAAYVIYTSGSTGVPKGVVVPHRGLADLVAEQRSRFDIEPGARVLHVASPSFDAAVLELLWAFASGGRLVIAPPTVYGGNELAQLLSNERVTHVAMTPTALATVDPAGLESLETVVVGGEAPPPDLVSRWAPGRRLFNTYGPAEATIQTDASAPLVAGQPVTVGEPLCGVGQVVLDARLRPVPVGVVGELYLTGPGLARGYRNRLSLTAARFVADPFAEPGQRMYRTGDLARWLRQPEGNLELDYVGRADFQVKLRGFRIELGEVESGLLACAGVARAVATVHNGTATGDRLIGYVVPEPGVDLDPATVLAVAGQRLAPHMVPATVMVLDTLPVTQSGKLDRAALPEPDFTASRAEFRAPVTDVEKTLAGLFAEILGIDTVGLDDSFFALGGDSIMSIQLVTRARAAGVVFSTREVFERKTVAGLAQVAVGDSAAAVAVPAELPGGGVGPVALTPIMCWMFERGGFDRFCQWVTLTLPTGIDRSGIEATVQAVIDHHDMLRAQLHPDPTHATGWALQVRPTTVSATEVGATEVNATEVGATEVNATEVSAAGVGATKVTATKVTATKVNATEVSATKVTAIEVSAVGVGATGVGATKVTATKVTATKVNATEVSATKVTAIEVSAVGVGATGVGATEVNATEVGATGVGATEVNATEVGATGVGATEVNATEVGATGVGATEVSATGVGATGVGATEVNATGVGATRVGATEVNATGVGATRVGATEVNAAGVNAAGVNAAGVNAAGVNAAGVSAAGLVRRVSVAVEPDSADFAVIVDAEANAAAERLDPAAGVMMQLVWFDWADRPGRLLVLVHHLVVDGVSWRILVPDFASAWAQIGAGQPPQLAPVGTSMRRWAHGLSTAAEHLDELDWWQSTLDTVDPMIGARPLDPDVDVQASVATVEVTLPTVVTRAVLTTLPQAFRGSVDDALIAGLALALTRWRHRHGHDSTETLLTLESHGRHDAVLPGADLTRTVGWFTTTYPVRLDLSGIDIDDAFTTGPAAGALIKSVKEQLREVPNRGIGYGLLRYLNPDTAAVLGGLPEPQVSFNYLGRFDTIPAQMREIGWLPAGGDSDGGGIQNPDAAAAAVLAINAATTDTPDGPTLSASWDYPTGLLTAIEVTEIAELWREAVTALATHAARPGVGGLTPSDVGLVDLDQPAIDRLEARYPALDDIWPLTPLQAGLLFHAQLATDAIDAYIVQLTIELGGRVDADRLHRAAQTLLARHPNLRTAFVRDGAREPVQVIPHTVDVPFTEIDLTEHDDTAAALEQITTADRRFDMTTAPLLRLTLIGIAPQQYRLLLSMHHILIDGWSTPLLVRELLVLYATDSDTAALPSVRPYRDYLMWLKAQDQAAAEAAWTRALDGITAPTLLAAADRARRNTTAPREVQVQLSETHTAALVTAAQQQETTLNTVIQAAWALVLANATAREDVVFGTTVSGRPPHISGIESMVGLFVNTVPVRVRLDHHESLAQLLRRIQTEQVALLDHHHLGLAQIQQLTGPGAMFDTVTVFESYPVDSAGLSQDTDIAGMHVLDVQGRDAAHYPLGLIAHHDTQLKLTFKYLPELFDHHHIDALADRVLRVLHTIAAHINLPLTRLELLSPVEQATLVPVRGRPGTVTSPLPQVLADAATTTPGTEALVCDGVRMSYRELDEASNRWAQIFIARGIGPEVIVAVALPRCIDAMIAVWAVAKTGGAFVQVDPTHPRDRVTRILTDSGAAVGLTLDTYRDRLPDGLEWLALDDPTFVATTAAAAPTAIDDHERTTPLRPEHPAYLIYTSGSTGTPKGVVVTHTGIANLAAETRERYGLTPASRMLAVASPTFDVSILEWLSATAAGATLVLAPASVSVGTELTELITAEHVTHAAITPTMLAALHPDTVDTLETLILGGETCPPDLAAQWTPGRTVLNSYGATETTVVSCGHAPLTTTTGGPMTIGGPTLGFTAVVLDRRLRPVPVGVVGELYVAGPGLARGYHRQPATTAARFVPDPYGPPGTRMYRTGDLVAWTTERTLRFSGRSDLQLKINGHRIEPGDIEAALRDHPDIDQAAVTIHARPNGSDQLVGYVVPAPGTTPDTARLTAHLAARLPTHMIPTAILTVDRIPLTPTGKVDYKALPTPEWRPALFRPPSTALEATVCDAFAETLDIEQVGLDDGFFTLGGNSLAAATLVARLAESTGVNVPVQWIFTDPTPESLAHRIDAGRYGLDEQDLGDAVSVVLPLRAAGTEPPLFCVHPAVGLAWGFSGLVQHLDPDRPVYGLQSPAFSDATAEFETLDELAARYVHEIRTIQPHGPYHLLGYSLGGTIAHAIAARLRRDGESVATLAMMDTRVVTASTVRVSTPTITQMLAEFGGIAMPTDTADLTAEAAAELLHQQGGLFSAVTPEHLVTLRDDYTRLVELTRHHRPTRFDGDLIYFRAAAHTDEGSSPALAWNDLITGRIIEHPIAVRHERMIEPESLRAIGFVLTEHFRSAHTIPTESPPPSRTSRS
ncbi:amino acid adenylation domain-containing protein [Nocardia sp. CA-129566]|uniref:amino acid adenylation domain-containing protein n=1 Tax=Nocardia sp. CA-129566 TaxID=3239976 RepID=UPI003D95353D